MKTASCLAAALLGAGLLIGCAKDKNNVSYAAIRGNLTPELWGSIERPIDVDRHMAVTNDINRRLRSDDWGRVFYTNRPSTLTPLPVVNTSGLPH